MNKVPFLIAAFVLQYTAVVAQGLYMPRNIQHAVEKGTRTTNGLPGTHYWQNRGVYVINATVNTAEKSVAGSEKITYFNNSPDSLKSVVIRFVNNIHKPEAPRAGQVPGDFLTPGLKILGFVVNGERYTVNSDDWGTANTVDLNTPLPPRSKAEFEIEWSYSLSKLSGREGQIDPNTFFCAYFYPRISVYDDYNGWDLLPHTDGGEFYNDFNDYTVSIKVPTNYVVWATGTLENAKEVLQPAAFRRFRESMSSNKVIHVATAKDMEQGAVTSFSEWNEWKFTARNITDFTFATSNHFVWDAGSVTLADGEGLKRVSVQAAYKDTAADFKNYVEWTKYAIRWYSDNLPGVNYPYSTMTAIQGYADMEYPMMVNDASLRDLMDSRLTVDHEVAHTYFPFYMGINETRYAFMDEGWATTFEYLIGISENGKHAADSAYKSFRIKNWISNPATEMDQPLITMSSQLSGAGYGRNSYGKASLSYLALKDLLGDVPFKKALLHYMNTWSGKHPTPWDYFYSMNAGAGTDLTWFWKNWFFSNHYIDLKIKGARQGVNNTTITLENTGGFAVPFDVIIKPADGKEKRFHYTPEIWKNKEKTVTFSVPSSGKIEQVTIDGGIFMDATPADNTYRL
ncbi:M1 family metallopeptidase [Niabella pedocola]|uniref:M1 family metallopeptidase n=1 Tax=Niabella pedocola TaxID=1752077 RepID=A0ABS8PUF5_9BACT|nr:M1 family metallopeptidase [Niabella pedocola]MCD2424700.1 M1 family metallopeptidase [Niabella pedocola]